MPYIPSKDRKDLDALVATMLMCRAEPNGRLNYVLFKLCKEYIRIIGENYHNYKNYIGELNECAAEIRRRLLVPYEDERKEINGDIE